MIIHIIVFIHSFIGYTKPKLKEHEWCLQEATKRNFKTEDFGGGFIIDEMKIQVSCYSCLHVENTNHSTP